MDSFYNLYFNEKIDYLSKIRKKYLMKQIFPYLCFSSKKFGIRTKIPVVKLKNFLLSEIYEV